MADELREFGAAELKQYNGEDGRPVYIAYKGKVYDVTESKMWKTGTHMKLHQAGEDLTDDLPNAPHAEEVFERFPVIGTVVAEEAPPTAAEDEFSHLPEPIARLLGRFPFLERHPHPMTVHFPIVFMYAAPIFAILYLITGVGGFDVATFYMLGAAVLFSLVAIPTGFLTWWVNYQARMVRPVLFKIIFSLLGMFVAAGAFVWRLIDPSVLTGAGGANVLYLVLVLALVPIITVVGTFGATLTFPVPGKRPSRKQLEKEQQDR